MASTQSDIGQGSRGSKHDRLEPTRVGHRCSYPIVRVRKPTRGQAPRAKPGSGAEELRPKDSSGLNTAMFTTSNSFDINDQSDKNAIWNYFTSDVSQSRVVDAYFYATLSFTNTTTIHINSVNNSAQENCLIRMPMTTAV